MAEITEEMVRGIVREELEKAGSGDPVGDAFMRFKVWSELMKTVREVLLAESDVRTPPHS